VEAVPSVSLKVVMTTRICSEYVRTSDMMVYTRGSSDDWDRYARVTGDDKWSWKALQPYIMKVRVTVLLVYFVMLTEISPA
jgi:hypothetical protein